MQRIECPSCGLVDYSSKEICKRCEKPLFRFEVIATREVFSGKTSALLKEATRQKRNGDMDTAIQCLRDAYVQIEIEDGGYTVKEFLRLPSYLMKANRFSEAWTELNQLLISGYPSQHQTQEMLPMDWSFIYSKMAELMRKRKEFALEQRLSFISNLCYLTALFNQKRQQEFDHDVMHSGFLLNRHDYEDEDSEPTQLDLEIDKVLRRHIKSIPSLNIGQFISEIDPLLTQRYSSKEQVR